MNERRSDERISAASLSDVFEEASAQEGWNGMSGMALTGWPFWLAPPWYYWHGTRTGNRRKFLLLVDAISAAVRIREIALAVYHAGANIRWFDFSGTRQAGGISEFLVPVNAEEVFQVWVNNVSSLLEWLTLTKVNHESLAFVSPPLDGEPGVLFTADSDLRCGGHILWTDGMIVTAPHHGAEANAHVYRRFRNEAKPGSRAIWVRSDGRFKARPGRSYLTMKRRFCTLCRQSHVQRQDVRFVARSGKWKPVVTSKCSCSRRLRTPRDAILCILSGNSQVRLFLTIRRQRRQPPK